ncbi:MAG TPA: ABC transporter substrate-binding protein [Conexibacter sp.]|nr:ABC transporter substrate-binding protein [Conexibacter sp.]
MPSTIEGHMRTTLRAAAALAAAATLAVTAAACGSSDEGDAATSTSASGAAAGTTTAGSASTTPDAPAGTPVKVMAMGTFTGPFDLSYAPKAAAAAAQAVNAAGGVAGGELQLLTCDDGGDPAKNLKCAREAVDARVAAVVSIEAVSGDYVGVLEKAGIPLVAPYGLVPEELSGRTSFPITAGGPGLTAGAGAAVADAGAKQVAIVYEGTQAGQLSAQAGAAGLASRGLRPVKQVAMPIDTPDASSVVAASTGDDVDGVVLLVRPESAAKYLLAKSQSGSDALVGSYDSSLVPAVIEQLGPAADGVVMASSFKPPTESDDPGVKRYLDELAAYDESLEPAKFAIPGAGEQIWSAVHLFAETADRLDSVDAASVLAALPRVTAFDSGLSAPVDFAAPIRAFPGLTRIFNTKMLFGTVKDGAFVPTDGSFSDPLGPPQG